MRASRPADHHGLSALLAACLGRDALSDAVASALNANLLRLLSRPGSTLLVAENDGGHLVGFISLWSHWGLFEDAPRALVDALMVHPDWQDGAAPAALLEQALGAAQAMGCTRLEFVPSEDSLIPDEALRHFGFETAGRRYALDIA